jgi:hypothetical protein
MSEQTFDDLHIDFINKWVQNCGHTDFQTPNALPLERSKQICLLRGWKDPHPTLTIVPLPANRTVADVQAEHALPDDLIDALDKE